MNIRPMPQDFQEKSSLPRDQLCKLYGAGSTTIARWAAELGGREPVRAGPAVRITPDDFAEHAVRENNIQLMKRYRCGTKMLARWRKQTGVRLDPSMRDLAPVPEGFKVVAPSLSLRELRVRYGRCADTIRRWCQQCGVAPRKPATSSTRSFNPQNRPNRDTSRAGFAADYLRRFGPVWRADADGRPVPDGFFWNRGGRTVLTDDEIIDRALRNGWRENAWREVRVA